VGNVGIGNEEERDLFPLASKPSGPSRHRRSSGPAEEMPTCARMGDGRAATQDSAPPPMGAPPCFLGYCGLNGPACESPANSAGDGACTASLCFSSDLPRQDFE